MGDVTKVLTDLGISVIDNEGQCRSLRDVLEELNSIWDKLTQRQKDYICDIVKGDKNNGT